MLKKSHAHLPFYETHINYQRMMDQVEAKQAYMREEMDVMKGKMDQLLEAMMVMVRKEDNPQIIIDAKNIASQLGFASLCIPEVTNLEFGLRPGYTPPKGVTAHPPFRTLVVYLASQDHCAASTRQGFI